MQQRLHQNDKPNSLYRKNAYEWQQLICRLQVCKNYEHDKKGIRILSKQLDTLARIGMAGAIVDTYESQHPNPSRDIMMLLVKLKFATERAFELYERVTFRGIQRIDRKIEAMKKKTMLGKHRSIITFIDFALAVIDEPSRRSKSERKEAIRKIAEILMALRKEIGGENEYVLSSAAAARAADVWDGVEI